MEVQCRKEIWTFPGLQPKCQRPSYPARSPGISHTSTMRLGLRRYATPQLLNLLVPCLIPVFLRASPEFESGTPPPYSWLEVCLYGCEFFFEAHHPYCVS